MNKEIDCPLYINKLFLTLTILTLIVMYRSNMTSQKPLQAKQGLQV